MVASFWDNFKHDVKLYFLSWKLQFAAASKLRGAFVMQVVGMMVNNVGLLASWLFLFSTFGTINGWNGADFIGMQGISMIIFGLVIVFNAGIPELSKYIDQGAFDTYLTKPGSILMQIASSRIEIAALGDIVLGVVLVTWYVFAASIGLGALLLFLAAMIVGVVLMWCFMLLPFLLAFYMFDSDKAARNFMLFYVDSGVYPAGVLTGKVRALLLTVFPALFVGVVQLEVMRDMKWQYVLFGFLVAVVWLILTLWLFRRSLRRYESANLIGAR